jgi:hypothetical protein
MTKGSDPWAHKRQIIGADACDFSSDEDKVQVAFLHEREL